MNDPYNPQGPVPMRPPVPPKKKPTALIVIGVALGFMVLLIGGCGALVAGVAAGSADTTTQVEPTPTETTDSDVVLDRTSQDYEDGENQGFRAADAGLPRGDVSALGVSYAAGYNDGWTTRTEEIKKSRAENTVPVPPKPAPKPAPKPVPAPTPVPAPKPVEKPKPVEAPKPKTEPKPDVVKVSAGKLIKDFDDNELKADAKYKGKTLQVTGVVKEVDTELFEEDKYILRMDDGAQFSFLSVDFHGMSIDELSSLDTGDKVTVVGEFSDGGDLGVDINDAHLKG